MKTQKRALDGSGESIASVELGSPITLTSFANIGEVVWLNVPDHLAWPVLVCFKFVFLHIGVFQHKALLIETNFFSIFQIKILI